MSFRGISSGWPEDKDNGAWERVCGEYEVTEDGYRILSPTRLAFFFADRPARELRVTLHGVRGESVLCVESDECMIDVGGVRSPASRIASAMGMHVLAATGKCVRSSTRPHDVACMRRDGRFTILVDAETLLAAEDPAPALRSTSLAVHLFPGSSFVSISVETVPVTPFRPIAMSSRNRFDLDVCIDDPDDLLLAPWNERTFDSVMDYYRRNGVKRIHYIHNSGYRNGLYNMLGRFDPPCPAQDNIDSTYEAVGEFLPATVRAAHAHGMKVIAVHKPFESALPWTVPHGSVAARKQGRIPALGGMLWYAVDFTAAHPELRMERSMADVPSDLNRRNVGRIALNSASELTPALDPARLTLWTSDDNGRYTPLPGGGRARFEAGMPSRIAWDGLDLPARFFAVTCAGDQPPTFGNTIRELVSVRDTAGRPMPLTYSKSVNPARVGKAEFRVDGFVMDAPGHSLDEFHFVDTPAPFAFGIGRQRYLAGALCPAYPEVRDEWMSQVEDCIAAGVDGIDFRMHNHNSTFEWDAYGFSPPVVSAFRERHGIDILSEPFDKEDLRILRGSFYTRFLRQARARLREAGLTMAAHIDLGCYPPPQWPTYMELRPDWKQWIEEDLLDEITFKSFRIHRSAVPLEVTEYLRAQTKVRINVCPWLNRLVNQPSGPDELAFFLKDVLAMGADTYILYENSSIMKAGQDGTMELTHPWVMEMLLRHTEKPTT